MKDKNDDSIILSMKLDELISISAPDYIGYLWIDKNGDYTQDKEKLVKKEEIRFPQTRFAESVEDYEIIIKREAEKKNQNIEDYVEILLEDLKAMLDQNVNDYKGLNVDLTDKRIRVKKFIKYLQTRAAAIDEYLEVFNSEKGYQVFNAWRDFTNDDTKVINFEFIFWQLKYDNYLKETINGTNFLDWMINRGISRFDRIQSASKVFNTPRSDKRKKEYQKIKNCL